MNIHLAAAGEIFTSIQAHGAITIYKNQTGWTLAISVQSATFSHCCVEHAQRDVLVIRSARVVCLSVVLR
jgi:hypothetical protein